MKKLGMILLILTLLVTACGNKDTNKEVDNGSSQDNSKNSTETQDEVAQNKEDGSEDTAKEETEKEDTQKEELQKHENIKISVEEAFDMYLDKYPNTKINEIEFELEDDHYEYEIEGYDGNKEYELKINANSGEILEEDEDTEDEEQGELKRDDLGNVDKYLKEALADAGDGFWLDEYELKVKSNYTKFDIEVKNDKGDKIKYKYDFNSGELLKKE
ncbi:MAG TPA: PepSY domain-containing protein [Candidatus Dorea intestinavium]|nr:PepSY domain-containing protein [Candidatus Dorea intestinavium]